ncbi:putative aldehyde dehydrogenase, partial [Dissostichus eleginoides]
AECQPGLLAGCGKVNGGGKTSYCVTLERNGEGRPSVSSGLPYPQSKWTRAARGEATDTHRAKPTAHHGLSSLPGSGREFLPKRTVHVGHRPPVQRFQDKLCRVG